MMKKWVLIGVGLTTLTIWGTVLVFLFRPASTSLYATNHSLSELSADHYRGLEEEQSALRFQTTNEGMLDEKTVNTVIGKRIITKKWLEDVSKDGKLSIDTILENLDLNGS